jgi:putative peptidoglycan lipid II flippase
VGSVAALGYARMLMQLPVAVIGQAIATAALPTLARLASEGRHRELDETLLGTLRTGLALACLGAGAEFVFAEPLVRLLYEGGRFGAADTQRVASLLQIFAFAVPAWIGQQIAVRGFYARGETWRPMWLGTAVAVGAAALYFALGQRYGATGLAAAGVIGMTANAAATLTWLRSRFGGPSLVAIASTTARAAVVAGIGGLAAAALPPLGAGSVGAALDLAVGGAVFTSVSLVAIYFAGDDAQRDELRRILRRIFNKRR